MKVLLAYSLVVVLAIPGLSAEALQITAFSAEGSLVFKTPTLGTSNHTYRVECATSLVNSAWTTRRSVTGVGRSVSVTNLVSSDAPSMFYRVVSSSNSAAFVDGEYLVIDLSGGSNATVYSVTTYLGAAALPGGLTSDLYKTDRLLLRKLPKGAFIRGSPVNEVGRFGIEVPYPVTLTKDSYLGVYEVTQRQWELVMGNKPSYFRNAAYYATRPVERVCYNAIRENPDNTDDPAVDWPSNTMVNAASFMGKLRAKTGLVTLDLPTEAQWEYACRARTTTSLNSGYNVTNSSLNDLRMNEVGRNYFDRGGSYNETSDTNTGTAKAGSYQPNAWGLYDLHGNVMEWCLDYYGTYIGPETDPAGPLSNPEPKRLVRGGSFGETAGACRSAYRIYNYAWNCYSPSTGFRVARTL